MILHALTFLIMYVPRYFYNIVLSRSAIQNSHNFKARIPGKSTLLRRGCIFLRVGREKPWVAEDYQSRLFFIQNLTIMKNLIITALLGCLCLGVKAQTLPIDSTTKKVSYSGVAQADGSKTELYLRAKQWFVSTFKNANYVLQMDDKEAGRLIGKGTATGDLKDSWGISTIGSFTLNYTVYIFVKDGKYRYEISEFNEDDNHGGNLWKYNNYDISELATDPKYKKKDGTYKKDIIAYLKLTDVTGLGLSESIKKGMGASLTANKDF